MMSSPEFLYLGLIFVLFFIPKILERFYIPGGLSAFFIGVAFSLGFAELHGDPTINVLAILGISALFLFAGLEVHFDDLKRHANILLQTIALQTVLLIVVVLGVHSSTNMGLRASTLFGLALVTPSTGFIIDSMASVDLSDKQMFVIKTNAIATEILALLLMFITLQIAAPIELAGSTLGILALMGAVPLLFKFFVKKIAPFAPNSEFEFFLILAVSAAIITYKLGAYYLVGAFVVGVSVQRFKDLFPEMNFESMIHAMKLFSGFFIPFYFLQAGSKVDINDLNPISLVLGAGLVVLVAPLRLYITSLHRRLTTEESSRERFEISISMLPTLVFGLVLAGILKKEFQIDSLYFGALLTYTLLITFLPGLILKLQVKSPTQELQT